MLRYLHGDVIHEAFFKKYASKKFLKGKWMDSRLYFGILLSLSSASILSRDWAKTFYKRYFGGDDHAKTKTEARVHNLHKG